MEIGQRIRDYLKQAKAMQLATARDNKPANATVYYVSDDDLNLYWISTLDKRHSRHIEHNPRVAVAISVKETEPTVGIQLEGKAERITNPQELRSAAELYHAKYHHDPKFVEDFSADKRKHKFYKFTPEKIWLNEGLKLKEWVPDAQ